MTHDGQFTTRTSLQGNRSPEWLLLQVFFILKKRIQLSIFADRCYVLSGVSCKEKTWSSFLTKIHFIIELLFKKGFDLFQGIIDIFFSLLILKNVAVCVLIKVVRQFSSKHCSTYDEGDQSLIHSRAMPLSKVKLYSNNKSLGCTV